MKIKGVLAGLLVVLLLSAFAPLFAIALPEGRTLDEGHDSGYIDWSGAVNYANLNHRDALCPSSCVENVTQIQNGGTISGVLAGDVSYFEVMLAYSNAGGFGTATIQACSSSYSVFMGIGGATAGFNSFPLSVPSGCTSWSVSASGGNVYFRSVDANYIFIPPTSTFTLIPTETFTPTSTPTATETLIPGVTPSPTGTMSDTPTSTLTSTPSQTLPPGVTPSDTPIPPVSTNTSVPPSSGGGNPPIVPFVLFPSATQTKFSQVVPTTINKTSTPQHLSVAVLSSSVPACGTLPANPNASLPAGSTTDNPLWWFPLANISTSAALALLNSHLKKSGGGKTASLTPAGVSVPVPKVVWHKTTFGEWVMRSIRTLVEVTRVVWRTVTEAVARFVNRVRQVIDRIVHSEWVTTFKQVAKTFWENVAEKVPLLGLFGKFLGFIWKFFIKHVIRVITEAVRTLQTIIKNVIRTIVEKIQDGWNYITKQVSETIRELVEKVDWIRDWVTKEISVPELVWEMKLIVLPAVITVSTILNLLAGGTLTLGMGSLLGGIGENGCGCAPCPQTATPDYVATALVAITQTAVCVQIDMTNTAVAGTQTASAGTPTPLPCLVTNKDQLNTDWGFGANENLYNQEILNASNSSGVPAWVLKGLIASESQQFDPTSVSPSAAYGLTQITGSGLGYLVGSDEEIAKNEIQAAWNLMTPEERAKFPPLPSPNQSWSQWFSNLDYVTLKPLMQGYMLSSIDG